MNNYSIDFKMDSTKNYFGITDVTGDKPWVSTANALIPVQVDASVSIRQILLQTALTAVFSG